MNKKSAMFVVLVLVISVPAYWGRAADKPVATSLPSSSEKAPTVKQMYPGLACNGMTYAKLANLPKGTLLKSNEMTIEEKDLMNALAAGPKEIQEQLRKNAFFLLERIATDRLLLRTAKADAAKTGRSTSGKKDGDVIQDYFATVAAKVSVSEEEIAEFYKNNRDMCGGASLTQIKDQLRQYVLQEKQQQLIEQYIETLGRRVPIEVSATWTKEQAALAKDNPVDKARRSGKPSVVDFGATGCRPCDMMTPILATLKKKYEGKVNVLFVHVRQEQILGARYGIRSIPAQVFFDKEGKEVLRHTGFFPEDEIEKQLATMGVK